MWWGVRSASRDKEPERKALGGQLRGKPGSQRQTVEQEYIFLGHAEGIGQLIYYVSREEYAVKC